MSIHQPEDAWNNLFAYPFREARVLGSTMVYVEAGEGRPVVFLHGNPTWSFMWRNVIPHAAPQARCLAPDLPGMGRSPSMPGGSYRFVDHARYLDAWFDALDLRDVVLVLHDWGSALGFHWAARNPDRVAGIVHMESIALPRMWSDFHPDRVKVFKDLRGAPGEAAVLQDNVFIEKVLPTGMLHQLSDAEHDAYRAPFAEPGESRRPMLMFPRELPIENEPEDVVEAVEKYGRFLSETTIPKLFINAEPGALVIGRVRDFVRSWPNQQEITVSARHFVPEDAPHEVGRALAAFLTDLPRT